MPYGGAHGILLAAAFVAGVFTEAPTSAIRSEVHVENDMFGPGGATLVARLVLFPYAMFFLFGLFIDQFPLGRVRYKYHAVNAAICATLLFAASSAVLATTGAGFTNAGVHALESFAVQIASSFFFLAFYRLCVDLMAANLASRRRERGESRRFPFYYVLAASAGKSVGVAISAAVAFEWTSAFYIAAGALGIVNLFVASGLPKQRPLVRMSISDRRSVFATFSALLHRHHNAFVVSMLAGSALIPNLDTTILYVEQNFVGFGPDALLHAQALNGLSFLGVLLGVLGACCSCSGRRLDTPHRAIAWGFFFRAVLALPYLFAFLDIAGPDSLSEGTLRPVGAVARVLYALSREGLRAVLVAYLLEHASGPRVVAVSGMFLGFAFSIENIADYVSNIVATVVSQGSGVDSGHPRNAFVLVIAYVALNFVVAALAAVLGCIARSFHEYRNDPHVLELVEDRDDPEVPKQAAPVGGGRVEESDQGA